MERDGRTDALGGLILALLLCVTLQAQAGPAPFVSALPALPDDPALQAAFGAPVSSNCDDPRAWEALPGIGPKRADLLADAARQGLLRQPDDLLRVQGIGIKMAAVLAPRVHWQAPASAPRKDPAP
mgnify:CR=1 FL=1